MNDVLKEKLAALPDHPGCYMMKDSAGTIIYVGKAISLKNRVRSYFHGAHDPKTELLVANIVDLETIVVDSEAEALILEANLIRQHSPYYNILLRDDKHYPYLRLTMDEEFPRLMIARRAARDGSRYFGPYPHAGSMHQAVELIRNIFPLRTCNGRSFRPGQRACLNAHIGRCLAPCEGRISREDYGQMVEQVTLFLLGRDRDLYRQVREQMEQASEELRFEDAARLRDALSALRQVQERQKIDSGSGSGDFDVLSVAIDEDVGVTQVFFIRGGNVVSREHFLFEHVAPGDEASLLKRFIQDYYGGGQVLPSALYCNVLPEDAEPLGDLLSGQCGHKVRLIVPQRGDKKRLSGLVTENARLAVADRLRSARRREQRAAAGLEELRQVLGLPVTPQRIECYDISHIQGTNMVGSMSVLIGGVPEPKEYRRFHIKTLDGSNDFAALQEVLSRRWRHGEDDRAAGKGGSFAALPDLLVIDGGKGQLHAVMETFAQLGVAPPRLISLAKREEEVFVPERSAPLLLSRDGAALQLLQQIRDEAHRFAITFHRQQRGRGQTRSLLDDAPGIGPQRRKSLLRAFGSLKNIRAASEDELAAAPGMNRAAAARLFAWLHAGPAGEADAQHE